MLKLTLFTSPHYSQQIPFIQFPLPYFLFFHPSVCSQGSIIIEQSISTMKKYQLWLQRKSYSQHLFNLMKIKHSNHSPERQDHTITPVKRPQNDTTILHRYKEMEDINCEAGKLGDISYAITFKELKNRKIRLMKSFEIMNENMSMARRIKEVKSVFNHSKENSNRPEVNQRKALQKKIQHSNESLREQNFKRFMKWQNEKIKHSTHKYILYVQVIHLSKVFHKSNDYSAFWCEISTDKGFVKSEMVEMDRFQGHRLSFPLQSQLEKDVIFRLYNCKGLNSSVVGQVQFRRPELGEEIQGEYRSDDKHFEIRLKLSYESIRRERTLLTMK